MVRVPTAENQVGIRDLPGQRFQAFDNGAGEIIQAGKQIGNALVRLADTKDDIQQEVEAAGAKQLDLEYSEFEREALYNADSGFLNQQGANALNGRKGIEELLAKKRADILAKATSSRQRMMLERILSERLNSTMTVIGRHAASEGRRYADDAGNARIVNEQQNAIAAWNDPERLDRALGTVALEVNAWATRNGASPEQRELRLRSELGKAHAGIIDSIANTDPEGAKAWLDKHRDEILPSDADKIEDVLKPAVMKAKAGRIADEVRGVAGATVKNMPRDDDLAGRLAQVDKMGLEPELAEAVKREVAQGVALDQRMLADQRSRAGEQAWALVDEGRPVPPSLMATVSPSMRRSLRNAMEEGPGGSGGFARKNDEVLRGDLKVMAIEDPARFLSIDLHAARGRLTPSAWNDLRETQAKLRREGEAPVSEKEVLSVARRLLPAKGIATGNSLKAQADAGRRNAFTDALSRRAEEFARRHNRRPDEKELLQMGDQLLISVQVDDPGQLAPSRYLFGPQKLERLAFEIAGEGGAHPKFAAVIPEKERTEIVAEFRKAGISKPSEAQIVRAYTGFDR